MIIKAKKEVEKTIPQGAIGFCSEFPQFNVRMKQLNTQQKEELISLLGIEEKDLSLEEKKVIKDLQISCR